MSRITLGQLKKLALKYADMGDSEFPDDGHLSDLVNLGLGELHDLIVNNNGEEYFRKTTTFSVTSASESYDLPADFYKALALFHQSNGRRFPIKKWNPQEIGGSSTTPLSSGTIELWYVPQFQKLKSNKSLVDIILPFTWEDFAALHAAVRILIEEESDASALKEERERQRARIIAMLSPPDQNEPEGIVDIDNRWHQGYAALLTEPTYKYRLQGTKLYVVEVEFQGV